MSSCATPSATPRFRRSRSSGLQFGSLFGGAVVTETVFARQGIGRMAVNAILRKDYPLVQATVSFAAVSYVVVNILVDVSYAWLDPRIKHGRA